jgi:tight adherence protein C
MPDLFAYAAITLLASSLALLIYVLARQPPSPAPELGLRGWNRHQGLARSGWLRSLEPWLRRLGGWMALVPAPRLRARMDRNLHMAGDPSGLGPDEWMALSALAALVGAIVGAVLIGVLGYPPVMGLTAALVIGYMPHGDLADTMRTRRRAVNRSLPATFDLIGLCVSAGMTFPQAIKEVVARAADPRDPMIEELRQILRQLDLGSSRAHALACFADRVPIPSVVDFVATVNQSEAKGTPLGEVLAINATVLRNRRTMLAEEAAARAEVKMAFPLALSLMVNLIVIGGPLIIHTVVFGF